jgi:SAM-dependent methyltransferase
MGPGRLCAELSRLDWTVSGIDASEEMVAAARDRLPEAASRFERAEIEALPWEDASFDAVTATGVLEYSDVPRALRELARVLRPGGRAIVSYPNPSALYGIWKSRVWYAGIRLGKRLVRHPQPLLPRGAGSLGPARFTGLLETAGFDVDALAYTSYLVVPTPLDALLPRVTASVGARLERSDHRARRLLATQVVYAARKAAADARLSERLRA